MHFFARFFNLTLWYMTKLRVLVLSFSDFTDIPNAHLFLVLLFCQSVFMRGIEATTNFRADRAADCCKLPRRKTNGTIFKRLWRSTTSSMIIRGRRLTRWNLILTSHNGQCSPNPVDYMLRLYWSIHLHSLFAISTRQDSETLKWIARIITLLVAWESLKLEK